MHHAVKAFYMIGSRELSKFADRNQLIVDGDLLIDYEQTHKLVGTCFHHIGGDDVTDITNLSKSGLYDIRPGRITIIIPWSAEFNDEVTNGWTPTGYDLLLVPNGVLPDQFLTLKQAVALGVKRIKRVSGQP